MTEDAVVACPHVFVVDSSANYLSVRMQHKQSWKTAHHKFLMLLVGLALLGLLVEGYFVYRLYQKTESYSIVSGHPLCSNHSSPNLQDDRIMSQKGSEELNQIPPIPTFPKPFAHLLGSHRAVGKDNVLQWVKDGDAITQNMKYERGKLTVEVDGYYYLYSKVQLNAADECLLIQHRIMKNTSEYGHLIELMKSKSFRCSTEEKRKAKSSGMQNLWNNFLGGIFHLKPGDIIFVTLESKKNVTVHQGPTENFMGAFMVFPKNSV